MTKNEIYELLNSNLQNKRLLESDEIFNVPARIVCAEIVKNLMHELPKANIHPVHEVENNFGMEPTYQNNITTSISIKQLNELKKIVIAQNASAKNKNEFYFGDYKINVLHILSNDDLQYSKLIHQACLNAIVEYEKILQQEIEAKKEKRSLLQQKLEILQNPELRNKEINKLSEEINSIDQEINI